MIPFFVRLWRWLRSRLDSAPQPTITPPAPAAATLAAPAPARSKPRADEAPGAWYYLRNLLDNLDRHFVAMRFNDPEAYELHAKAGAYLLHGRSSSPWIEAHDIGPQWRAGARPGFGMVTWFADNQEQRRKVGERDDLMWCDSIYFLKLKAAPPGIQLPPRDSSVYRLGVCFNEAPKHFHVLAAAYIAITADGRLVPLKEYRSAHNVVHSRGRGRVVLPTRKWAYPSQIEWMHGEYRRKHNEAADTIEQYISWMFCTAAQLFAATDSAGLQVRASKGGITSTFSIDMLRTAYFFRDRDLKDEGGRRIFHIVRTHPRVRSHFRGARDFTWHGYQIHISVPGLHHWTASSFDVGAYEVEPDTRVPGMMPVSAVADMVASEQEK